jgi:hypothetical protein
MAVPQTLSFEDLQDILNVAAPTGVSAPSITAAPPMLGTPQMAGSSIAYIDRPSFTQAYSPENLPEFMKDFEQISPTLFAPSQGVFGQAPEVDTIQPLMPQQYVDEYADLERAFQESIAVDPTMFGDMYRGGLYMPVQTLPSAPEDEPFDLAGSLAAAEALRQIYPIAKEPLGEVEEAIKRGVVDPTEEFIQQKMLDPTEDAFKAVADPVEEFVQQYALDPTEDVAKIILDPVEEVIQQAVLDPIEDIAKMPLKAIGEYINQPSEEGSESVLSKISESLDEAIDTPEIVKSFEDDAKSFLDSLPETTTNLVGAYADVENMIDNPSSVNVDKAITAINDIGFDAKEFIVGSEIVNKNFPEIVEKIDQGAPIVPPVVGETLATVADIDAIIDAFENPDAESLTNAYAAADGLVATYTEAGGLPAGEAIGEVATIFTGLEALDGGIESAAEAVNVVNAANAVAGMAGVKTGASATAGFLPPNVTAALGPISMILSAPSIMKSVVSLAKGGAAGTYERIQGEFDLKDGKFAVGGGVRGADTNRSFGDKYARETMNSGVSMANSLVDDYGFEIDEQALNAAPENIMRLQTSGYYNREGRAQYGSSVGSADFVVKLLQNGVLKPTENTPPEILASNEAFASFVTDHIDKGQDEYAAKMYTDTGGTGAEFGRTTRAQGTTIKQRAKFATQDAAQSWADENAEEKYNVQYVTGGKAYGSQMIAGKRYGSRYKPFKTTVSYDVVPVEVGDKTYYELKKSSSKVRLSVAEYEEAVMPKPKPAPKPEPKPELAYDHLEFLRGLDFSNLGSFTLTL